jgi:pyruvate kinase
MPLPANKTKIVCTIGPASESRDIMERMLLAGMNVARLNFSHGNFAGHQQVIIDLRASAAKTGRRLAIMADLPGPKIRIGQLADEPLDLKSGDRFILTSDDTAVGPDRVSVSLKRLPQAVQPGNTIFLNDGLIQLTVEEVSPSDIFCRVMVGGELRSKKGLNLPGIDLGISAFTDHDFDCLKFALEQGVDAISQSFVTGAEDVKAVRQAAATLGYQPFVVAKIERSNALEHVEEILEEADGIMIARGDLGVEMPIEQIPVVQKQLMRQANRKGKPVITATQMLESMTWNSRPTRAEATDVANSIIDGTDCVMLSAESAMGSYPVEAVTMLAKIAAAIEPQRPVTTVREMFADADDNRQIHPSHLIALSVEASLEYAKPAAVFVPTRSGSTARHIGQFRLPVWIVAVSSQETTCRRLQFSAGVFPVHEPDHPEHWNSYIATWLDKHGLSGTLVLLTEGPSTKHPDANYRMEVLEVCR